MQSISSTTAQLAKRIRDLENELEASQKREKDSQALVQNSPDILYRTDLNGIITFASSSVYRLSGYTVQEAIGMNMADKVYLHPEEREKFIEELSQKGSVTNFVAQLKRKDGSIWWASTNAHFLKNQSGAVIAVEGITRDVTATMETDLELRQIFSMSLDPICILDLETATFTKVNPAFTSVLGYSENEFLNKSFFTFIHPDEIDSTSLIFEEKLNKGIKVIKFRTRCMCKNGGFRWLSWVFQPLLEQGLAYTIARDVTEDIFAANALRDSEKRFRNIVESSPMGVYLYELDSDDRLILKGANRAADRITGVDNSKFIGMTIEEAFPALVETEIPKAYRTVCRKGVRWSKEQVEYKDQQISGAFEVHTFQTSPGKIAVFFFDITERKIAEEEKRQLRGQLQQAQKMEAIGTLAGGIAHDFNNILMGIQGRVSLAMISSDNQDAPINEHLQSVENYIKIAVDLTKQLLGFARAGKYEVKPININNLVKTSADMFGRTKKEIRIDLSLEDTLYNAEGDHQQMHQVLLNLYVNAWQAMPGGGDLHLKTENVDLDDSFTKPFELVPGRYIKISVTDNGIGMDEAILQKMFEPFFTTKAKSRGTGLGLASAYGIVKNHSGIISAVSQKGGGTTFEIYLPASMKDVVQDVAQDSQIVNGKEKILLVDDEVIVLEVGSEMLKTLGYNVHHVSNGKEAVEYYEIHHTDIDLVILDMIMPEMDGNATFDKLKDKNPNVLVLLSSGYSLEGKASSIMSKGCKGFIQKPFSLKDLSVKIRGILDS